MARALSRAARQECCRYRSDYSEGGIIDWNLQCARILGLVRGYIGQGVGQEMLELLIEEGERKLAESKRRLIQKSAMDVSNLSNLRFTAADVDESVRPKG